MISAVINYEDGKVSVHTSKAKNVSEEFPSGFFDAIMTQEGLKISENKLSELHQPHVSEDNNLILNSVYSFFKEGIKEKVNDLGFVHKLGILLHGKQGTGKTSMLNYIANSLIENRKAIVFFCNNYKSLSGAISISKMIREIQDNPIIFIADEFERYASEAESEMKNLLDGNDSIDNSLFLAATNYIDRVPNTLKDRPSRFRIVKEIKGISDKKLIKSVLSEISNKISPSLFSDKELDLEIKNLSDVTLDEIKHIALNKITESFIKTKSKPTIGFKKEEDALTSIGINKWPELELYPLSSNKSEKKEFNGSNI